MFRTLTSNSPFSAPRDDTARASCGNGAKSDFLSLTERKAISYHCPMYRTLTSNSPFSAPRDDTARASCGNGAKSDFLSLRARAAETERKAISYHSSSSTI
jgi:hypothetical protein